MRLKGNIGDLAYETSMAAGFDLRSAIDIVLYPANPQYELVDVGPVPGFDGSVYQMKHLENWYTVPTGVYIEHAEPHEFLWITPRSGLARHHGITVLNSPGLIDPDYEHEIGVVLINLGQEAYGINKGDRIAQAVLQTITRVENIPTRDKIREGGFGSTGEQ